jgi:hypothetical protein
MTWKAYGLFAGAALVLAGYASAADDTDPAELQTERVAHALSEHQDADSLAAAALLQDLFVAQIIAARRDPNPPGGWTEDRAR